MLTVVNISLIFEMSSTESSMVVKMPQPSPAAKAKKAAIAANNGAKKSTAAKKKPTYAAMITQAIIEMKQKKGSSRAAIMKHIAGVTNTVPNALLVKKTVKKMVEAGTLVPGADAGKTGSGSFKVSPVEKLRLKQAEKAAAKKVAQTVKKVNDTKKVVKKGSKKIAKQATKKSAATASKKFTGSVKKVSAKKGPKGKVTAKSKKVGAKPKKV